jgi:hypothetical protein
MADGEVYTVRGPRLRHEDRIIVGALLILGAVAAGLRFNDQMIGLTGDNASYILLAHAMLTGQPYGSAESPWGYPALLTPIMVVIGPGNFVEAIPWLKLLTILFFLASLPLMYLLFMARHSPVMAFGATMLFALTNVSLWYANDVMTEIPYLCATFAALLYWQRRVAPWARDRAVAAHHWRTLLVAVVLIEIAYYIRSVGVTLFAAAVAMLLWYRRLRAMLLVGALLAGIALPWVIFSSTHEFPGYWAKFLLRNPFNPSEGYISSVGEFLIWLGDSARINLVDVFSEMLLPAPVPPELRAVVGPLLAVLIVGGLALRLARRVELPEVYTLFFLLLLFASPFRADRILLPFYPLLLHYMFEAVRWIVRRLAKLRLPTLPRRSLLTSTAGAALLLLLAFPNTWVAGVVSAENLRYLTGKAPPIGHTPDWQAYFEACEWIRKNAPPDVRTMSRKFTLSTLYSDRPSMPIPFRPPDQYPEYINYLGIAYVLEDAFEWSTQTRDYLRPALSAHPQMFQLVYVTGPPETRVWKVVR